MTEDLLVHDENAVRVLTLNRPHALNAVTRELITALREALVAADEDPGVRCIVLTGAGDRAFCAGGDLKQLPTNAAAPGGQARVITDALRHRPAKPMLGAVNGLAYGGGLEVLLVCDLVVCAEHARFALPEVTRGLVAAGGGLVQLPRLIGPRRALQLILTGTPIDAATALVWGLVNQVVPADQLSTTVMTLARTIAANAPVAVRVSKRTALAAVAESNEVAVRLNEEAFTAALRSPDSGEGMRAFAEGRPPSWTGRTD